MRNTLYFALPDVSSAERAIRDLLEARIELPRIHCLARRGLPLGDLPETNILQKADVAPVAGIGFTYGAMLGGIVGGLVILFPPPGAHLYLWTIPIAATIGAMLGVGVSSVAGVFAPNSKIAAFERDFAHGDILLMVDVPYARSLEIVALVQSRHPTSLISEVQPTPALPNPA